MFLSRLLSWCIQRVANLGLVALICLVMVAFVWDRPSQEKYDDGKPRRQITNGQLVYVYYTLFVHVLGVLFPLRLCWAVRSMTRNLKMAVIQQSQPLSTKTSSNFQSRRGSDIGYEDSVSSDSSDSIALSTLNEVEWDEKPHHLLHAIILPNYKEDLETLRETLDVLACHPQASSSYEIYLAMEQGESGCKDKAAILIKEYDALFRSVEYTLHPRDIPGEAQGKSSNLSWAAKYINAKYPYETLKRNVIITVLDADTHLSNKHFSQIASLHYLHPMTAATTMYVPPIIFDRNAHLVPRLVRVADLLWAGAGLSGHYRTSSICPPTSVYSLPLSLVDIAGGWDAGEEAIGEDLHMYIKCFFALNGNLTTRSIYSAASHSNVHSIGKGIRGFFQDILARYRQAMRHMWGALDSGYVLKSALTICWRGKSGQSPHWTNIFVLGHRMYEAHFLPIHITFLVVGSGLYQLFTATTQIPSLLLQTLDLTGYLRLISFLIFLYFFYLYETYHYVCVSCRETEMVQAGLADRLIDGFSYRSLRKTGGDFVLFPVSGILFGSIPATLALIWQLWTLSLVYKVSKKPQRMSASLV